MGLNLTRKIVSALLPCDYREHVHGDLEERGFRAVWPSITKYEQIAILIAGILLSLGLGQIRARSLQKELDIKYTKMNPGL